jgi:hypothetical protein
VQRSASEGGRLRLVLVADVKAVWAFTLSVFGRCGLLPEWHSVLVCHRGLALETIANFIRRAAAPITSSSSLSSCLSSSVKNEKMSSSRLHVLAFADNLPFSFISVGVNEAKVGWQSAVVLGENVAHTLPFK